MTRPKFDQLLLPNPSNLSGSNRTEKGKCEFITDTTDDEDYSTSRKATHHKFNTFYFVLLVLAIGVFIFFHSWFSKTEYKRSNDRNTTNTVEEKTAALARLMNAISLQNEFNDGTVTMKEVMSEALDVRNSTLLDHR
uniref:WSN domain-containing protein n=1 Tax=Caenorhabditis japonica TaxID=281687 RepID=A0A8R1EGY3_CAEJA